MECILKHKTADCCLVLLDGLHQASGKAATHLQAGDLIA